MNDELMQTSYNFKLRHNFQVLQQINAKELEDFQSYKCKNGIMQHQQNGR